MKCRNAPIEELEAEFFGTNEGEQQSAGKLELSMGGTLFLDEVEKLPSEMGDKLAEALLHGLPSREKGGKPRMFDVRVIAACDSNLKRLAAKGLFLRKQLVAHLPAAEAPFSGGCFPAAFLQLAR